MRVFVDSNVFIDYIFCREKHFDSAKKIFEYAFQGRITIFITALTVINTCYIAKKYNISIKEIKNRISLLLEHISIAEADTYAIYKALLSDNPDPEDDFQYFSALKAKADIIVTRDKIGFSNSIIKVLSSDEFISAISS